MSFARYKNVSTPKRRVFWAQLRLLEDVASLELCDDAHGEDRMSGELLALRPSLFRGQLVATERRF